MTRRTGMDDAWHLLEENGFEVRIKKESIVLVPLSHFIEFLPLYRSKCRTAFDVVVQLEEYTCG